MSTDDPNPSDLPPAVRETLDSLGGALGDIAELDKEQLNETIGLLETLGHDQAAGILRSRREVLKGAGAATGLGIAGLAGATATGGARAQSDTQTGTIGNGNQDADLQDVSAESVSTDNTSSRVVNETRFVAPSVPKFFDTVQAAVDDLVAGPGFGDVIILENLAETNIDLTGTGISLIGFGNPGASGAGMVELDTSGGDGITMVRETEIRNLRITGDGTSFGVQTTTPGDVVRNNRLQNVFVDGTNTGVIYTGRMQDCHFDVHVRNASIAHHIDLSQDSGDFCNANTWERMVARTSDEGVRIDDGAESSAFSGNSIEMLWCEGMTNSPFVVDVNQFADNNFSGYGFEAVGSDASVSIGDPSVSGENVWNVRLNQGNSFIFDPELWAEASGRFVTTPGWTDETANRSFDTEFTNDWDVEREVQVRAGGIASGDRFRLIGDVGNILSISEINFTSDSTGDTDTMLLFVPPGETYEIRDASTTATDIDLWTEKPAL